MVRKRKRKLKKRNPLAKLVRELFKPKVKPSGRQWKRRARNEKQQNYRGVE